MINKKEIKEIARKHKKKISEEALLEINNILTKETEERIIKAARNSSFFGRKIILKEDLK